MHVSEGVKSSKVLVVDGSRVVRASLSRCLARTQHAVCEEADGESAWQSLVLDASIIAVISGLDVSAPDGAGLVERMRASKLSRINAMPFYQLASDSLADAVRQQARQFGVTDFIPKSAPAQSIQRLFGEPRPAAEEPAKEAFGLISDLALGDLSSRFGRLASLDVAPLIADSLSVKGKRGGHQPVQARAAENGAEALSAGEVGGNASVLIFGIDDYAGLCQRFGKALGEKIVSRFSALLTGKVRAPEDVLQLSDGRIGIVSSQVDREHCTAFARRVCKAMAAATIAVGGNELHATVSAGVAAVPQDGVALSAEELFYLASSRLEAAHFAGGNRVVFRSVGGGRNLRQAEFIDRLRGLLVTASPATEMSCKSWLRSICVACRNSRPDGEPPPCSAAIATGLCCNEPLPPAS